MVKQLLENRRNCFTRNVKRWLLRRTCLCIGCLSGCCGSSMLETSHKRIPRCLNAACHSCLRHAAIISKYLDTFTTLTNLALRPNDYHQKQNYMLPTFFPSLWNRFSNSGETTCRKFTQCQVLRQKGRVLMSTDFIPTRWGHIRMIITSRFIMWLLQSLPQRIQIAVIALGAKWKVLEILAEWHRTISGTKLPTTC